MNPKCWLKVGFVPLEVNRSFVRVFWAPLCEMAMAASATGSAGISSPSRTQLRRQQRRRTLLCLKTALSFAVKAKAAKRHASSPQPLLADQLEAFRSSLYTKAEAGVEQLSTGGGNFVPPPVSSINGGLRLLATGGGNVVPSQAVFVSGYEEQRSLGLSLETPLHTTWNFDEDCMSSGQCLETLVRANWNIYYDDQRNLGQSLETQAQSTWIVQEE